MMWMDSIGLEYHVGVDGISGIFILLTSLLTFICITSSIVMVKKNIKEYMVCFLLLESITIGFFCSMNLLLFYIFFEIMLIPMYLIIGIWGGENRVYAALKFFLYTFFGSLCFLVAMLHIYNLIGSFEINILSQTLPLLPFDTAKFLWLGMLIAFAIKIPMFPFHTWLPDAHVQAPTGGSVILAGILLKVGGYGLVRVLLPLFPSVSMHFADIIILLSVVAIIYGSLVAMAQSDMKKMIAYSSIAHMGYVTSGIFSFTFAGFQGAVFQMFSHGIISSGLFLVVGSLYERMHTKEIDAYGAVASKMPLLATFFMIYTLGSIGLPGTSGFVGEFMSLVGVFNTSPLYATLAATGVVLGAIYMLNLYKRLMLGDVVNSAVLSMRDINAVEILSLSPLALLTICIGICPNLVTQFIHNALPV
jgi:NADH-quinone oxidoreductase subunit M